MGRRILVVDDDGATRSGLVALLQDAGYTVVAVGTLQAAKQALTAVEPDLVITDVRLGAYNGLHLLVARPKPIPTIVITGFPDSGLEADAHKMGAEFLVKPIAPTELLALIERQLAQPSAPYEPARRWRRVRLTTELPARVGQTAVRIVDVSYGGFRLLFDRAPEAGFAPSFQVTLPTAAMAVSARVVWEKARDTSWICGAVVSEDSESMWRQFVDATV